MGACVQAVAATRATGALTRRRFTRLEDGQAARFRTLKDSRRARNVQCLDTARLPRMRGN
jgi:hypothetical protein